MINYRKILLSFHKYNDISLLIMRALPAYYMFINHGLSKITNPAKWDINSRKINQVRENLMLLNYSPEQLRDIPSFRYTENRLTNPLSAEKYSSLIDMAKNMDRPIISDRAEDMATRLAPGEVSVAQQPNRMFDQIYRFLTSHGKELRNKDSISVKEADAIVREFKRIEPSVKTLKDMELLMDKAYKEKANDFETVLISIVQDIRNADVNGELGISIDSSNAS